MKTVGITDTMGSEQKFKMYKDWLEQSPEPVRIQVLSYALGNGAEIDRCDALVLTGGHDVHPSAYGPTPREAAVEGTDLRRDDFERQLLDHALKHQLPILGICRGMQLANVHLGGTLITDIVSAGYPAHDPDIAEYRHEILVEPGSTLATITASGTGMVNSSHHQAVDRPAAGLRVAARSRDGIVEALELGNGSLRLPFFLLIQYHPERMRDTQNPFSSNVRERFVTSITHTTEYS